MIEKDFPMLMICDKLYRLIVDKSMVTENFLAALISVHGRREVEIEANGASSSMVNIAQSVIQNLRTSLPPIDEQVAISKHLNDETTCIDDLLGKKIRFIDLLREKRQALITHAVTKGLNPNVKMQNSGVEWLGEVPEHWAVIAMKRIVLIPITDGPHETPNFVDEGIPFVSAEAVSTGKINFEKIRSYITKEDNERYAKKYRPEINDIFMVKSGATTGITAIVEKYVDFNIWSPLAVIRCGVKSNPFFVLNYMRSTSFKDAVELNWSFGTQQNIGMEVIGNLAVTVPPIDEQTEIANYINRETFRLDTLISKTKRSIELLKERRSALITAAVTGQIDVRERAVRQDQLAA